ncbi:MBL fold metallo-hydrolase [Photobacterium minamisatsumaniensis]|uniref:MBL fold metallo-hydrolase n=1 Tax=Photobacterium minamisatsumaniensis TaxID=2910233 RepID=UPI003D147CB0
MANQYYLRSDVYFEPLFNNWYVWPYLLAPATGAMNMANHQQRLLKSFIANAKLHAASAKHKAMVGSSMVDCREEQVDQVKAILQQTQTTHANLLDFAQAIRDLDDLLREKAHGESLEPLYAEVPECLKGYVELVYDLNNQPSYRLIEGLLYLSEFYKPEGQSLCFGVQHSDERPFVLSTPRLADEHHLHIKVPFDHPFTEAIFRMREEPQSLEYLRELLGESELAGGLDFESLFTTEAPRRSNAYQGQDVKVNYLGHAGVMVETNRTCIMVDPVIPYTNDEYTDKLTFEDLPPFIDYVMVTHTHMDHVCIETLLQLKHKIGTILVPKNNGGSLADPSIKLMLQHLGFPRVQEMEDMESLTVPDGKITALPFLGEHADVNVRSKAAWLVNLKGRKILLAADSSNIDHHLYEHIYQFSGDVDALYIGMECTGGPLKWLYGSLLTQPISKEMNESRRFNGSDFSAAVGLVEKFNVETVNVYALGMEPWYRYFMGIVYNDDDAQMQESQRLVDYCKQQGRSGKRLFGKDEVIFSAR